MSKRSAPDLAIVLGIRPDVIRASLILRDLLADSPFHIEFVWSGQHYSDNLKDVFFRQLGVPAPNVELAARGGSDSEFIADLVSKLGVYFNERRPRAVAFLGDTNTVMGAVAAASLNIPIIHIEGCMRSYDWRMPEEKYRTVIDHLADVIYAYLPAYAAQGIAEGIPSERIVVTGNPIVDVLEHFFLSGRIRMAPSAVREMLKEMGVKSKGFLLMTCHRRENVEDAKSLDSIFALASSAAMPVIFPASYRTQREWKHHKLALPENLVVIPPIGYVEFLELMDSSLAVLTDSGTVVEEASVLLKPSIQMRRSTERPEVYQAGGSIRYDPVSPTSHASRIGLMDQLLELRGQSWVHQLGDGEASQKIVADVKRRLEFDDLSMHSPDLTNPLVARAYQ